MLKNKDQEQLESYVLGNLSKKEEEIIENRLLEDSDFKKENNVEFEILYAGHIMVFPFLLPY